MQFLSSSYALQIDRKGLQRMVFSAGTPSSADCEKDNKI